MIFLISNLNKFKFTQVQKVLPLYSHTISKPFKLLNLSWALNICILPS